MGYTVSRIVFCPVAAYDRINHLAALLDEDGEIPRNEAAKRLQAAGREFHESYIFDVEGRLISLFSNFPMDVRLCVAWCTRRLRDELQAWRDYWSFPGKQGPMTDSWDELRKQHREVLLRSGDGLEGCVCAS